MNKVRERLLLHVCCAPDATVALERLSDEYEVALFFENSNIDTPEEYQKRFADLVLVASLSGNGIINAPYEPFEWSKAVAGLEDEPEGGRRCEACFRFRLGRTAAAARDNGFSIFATTLTVSPHKNAELINKISEDAAKRCGVNYLPSNFKKKNGFERSVELSKKHGLYRQKYCGCIYSKSESGK